MKFIMVFLILLSFPIFLKAHIPQGKILIISDIDDTIKVSRVRFKPEKIIRGFRPYNVFPGMNYLYHTLGSEYHRSNFYYVSAAIKWLSFYWHSKTLEFAGIPPGELILRGNQEKMDFKLSAIRRILAYNTTKRVVLIGDNAELDPVIYKQIQAEFPKRKFIVLIRKTYHDGNPILENQISFVSPMQAAVEFYKNGVLNQNTTVWLLDRLLSEAYFDLEMNNALEFFPEYTRGGEVESIESIKSHYDFYTDFSRNTCAQFFFQPLSRF